MPNIPLTLVSCGKGAIFSKQASFQPDLVIDCRGIRNPFRDPVIGVLSGSDPTVQAWVEAENGGYVQAAIDMIEAAAATAHTRNGGRGKDRLLIAFFCLAGQHRSPAMKHVVGKRLSQLGYQVEVS